MFPKTLALVDDDRDYATYLSQHLSALGIDVQVFERPADFLVQPGAYAFDFYLMDLSMPGVDGVELIKILRLRSRAGVLVVSGRADADVFASIVKAGADMFLAKPVNFEQVSLAIEAVHRRSAPAPSNEQPWLLDQRSRDLVAPDGTRIALSDSDLQVMLSLAEAGNEPVSRETLRERLGYSADDNTDSTLNAAIFRLRRRIERATPLPVPLQAKSRVGYQFRAVLRLAP